MHPDVHLSLDRIRAAELRESAHRWRLARVPRSTWTGAASRRIGWALIETGLRLVHHSASRKSAVAEISGDLI
ncbi:hypothetical protein [Nonomuraea sp. SBT364]|uniref:hypothetical protein n=1 Tax=Nonomuraea sp. SBT364 TaxID=1580530 RepID=UPI00066DB30A|nr:hypothetical protein [Nonomuraea sp. SBT364]